MESSLKEVKFTYVPRNEIDIHIKTLERCCKEIDALQTISTRLQAYTEIKERFLEEVKVLNSKMEELLHRTRDK